MAVPCRHDPYVLGRGRLRAGVVVLASLLGAVGCSGSAGLPTPSFNNPCPAKPQGGGLCINVMSVNGVVRDVIGYLSLRDSPLAGRRWRLVLSSYGCDPGTGPTPACAASKTYPTAARHGMPPLETFCRQANGDTNTASPGCHDALAAEYASQGAWIGFPGSDGKGYRVGHQTWLCIAEQTASGHTWTTPTPQPTPPRACSSITSK